MTVQDRPSATLSHLYRTDGSATFSQNGYTIIGAVNGPIEVQRKDELPEEAAVEVIVRPATGAGGTDNLNRSGVDPNIHFVLCRYKRAPS